MKRPAVFRVGGMHDRLREILESKRVEIEALLPRAETLRRDALRRDDFRGFRRALEPRPDGSLGLIAEIKKASPSVGVIATDFDPPAIARRYEQGGADCISILTDAPFFQGRLDYVQAVRDACALPLLRKDFILHEAQIYESICAGADAILLIAAALETGELDRLLRLARDFQLDVLVEVHSLAEMERVVDSGADLIGINNRNLSSFVVDLGTTEALADEVSEEITLVSESGLRTAEDSRRVHAAGADAILVGETLMRCSPDDLAAKIAELTLRAESQA
jgi:indole-3-glycerol phosphate synthase